MKINSSEWLAKLIAFDTTSSNSNLSLIEAMREFFAGYGMTTQLIYNGHKDKANIFATLPAADGTEQGGIILSGHTDVVPANAAEWSTSPFVATVIDRKIFGRGACDMKGFLAVVLAMIPEFKRLQLPFPIHCAFTYDEEVGCQGIDSLIKTIQELQIQPALCIVGEPTMMNYVVAHKGIQSYHCRVHGQARHSSLTPCGCNAIEYAAKVISFLHDFAERFKAKHSNQYDERYDVPYTTISTNMVRGGVAHNVIPEWCDIVFEFRNLPHMSPSDIESEIRGYIAVLEQEMRKEHPATSIVLEKVGSSPSFATSVNLDEFPELSPEISLDNKPGCVAYATEAGYFEQVSIKTLICGPGSINQAHQIDEYLDIEQLAKCEKFLLTLVRYFAQVKQ